jgi:hypothetical protein
MAILLRAGAKAGAKGPQPKSPRDGLVLQKRGAPEGLVVYDGSKFVWNSYGG